MKPTVRTRRLFTIINGGTPTGDPGNWDGDVPWATPIDLARVDGSLLTITDRTLTTTGLNGGSRAVPPKSLIISTRAPIGYVAETATNTAFNQGCRGLIPRAPLVLSFFRYQFVSLTEELVARGQGSTFNELSSDALADLPLTVPPLADQDAIASYLDRETARIDALVDKKNKMVSLLAEAEQSSLLNLCGDWRSVESWSLRQTGAEVVTGPFGTHLAASEYIDNGVPVINPTHINKVGAIEPDPQVSVSEDVAKRLTRHRVKTGDLLLGRKGDVGRSAVIAAHQNGWLCGSDAIAVRTNLSTLNPDFLALVLHLELYRQQLKASSTGAMMASLNESNLLNFRLPRLSLDQQATVLREATSFVHSQRRAAALVSETVAKLRERRRAMITAAVTGQLDIPESA